MAKNLCENVSRKIMLQKPRERLSPWQTNSQSVNIAWVLLTLLLWKTAVPIDVNAEFQAISLVAIMHSSVPDIVLAPFAFCPFHEALPLPLVLFTKSSPCLLSFSRSPAWPWATVLRPAQKKNPYNWMNDSGRVSSAPYWTSRRHALSLKHAFAPNHLKPRSHAITRWAHWADILDSSRRTYTRLHCHGHAHTCHVTGSIENENMISLGCRDTRQSRCQNTGGAAKRSGWDHTTWLSYASEVSSSSRYHFWENTASIESLFLLNSFFKVLTIFSMNKG